MRTKLRAETEEILEEAHHWILLLENPESTRHDQARFEDWLLADPRHGDIYDRAITFRTGLMQLDKSDFTARVNAKSLREQLTVLFDAVSQLRLKAGLGIALGGLAMASFLIFPVLPHMRSNDVATNGINTERFATNIGETKQIGLADGTQVTLGAASEFNVRYSGDAREIELIKGAAFVDVAPDPDKPFSVKAGGLTAMALGTAFDVRHNVGVMRVAVSEGTVEVSYPLIMNNAAASMRSRRKLVAGEQIAAVRAQGMGDVKPVTISKIGAWRQGRLVYSGASLAEVIADANRYSSTPIEIEDNTNTLAGLKLNGVFIGQDIDALLTTLTDIHPITIDRGQTGRIVLRPRT